METILFSFVHFDRNTRTVHSGPSPHGFGERYVDASQRSPEAAAKSGTPAGSWCVRASSQDADYAEICEAVAKFTGGQVF